MLKNVFTWAEKKLAICPVLDGLSVSKLRVTKIYIHIYSPARQQHEKPHKVNASIQHICRYERQDCTVGITAMID